MNSRLPTLIAWGEGGKRGAPSLQCKDFSTCMWCIHKDKCTSPQVDCNQASFQHILSRVSLSVWGIMTKNTSGLISSIGLLAILLRKVHPFFEPALVECSDCSPYWQTNCNLHWNINGTGNLLLLFSFCLPPLRAKLLAVCKTSFGPYKCINIHI